MTNALSEFFTLARAERAAREFAPPQYERIRTYHDAGERRLLAGRRVTQPISAAVLLREAVLCYLLAAEIARDEKATDESLAARDLGEAMPELPAEPMRPDAIPSDDARVRAALAARDVPYFDRLSGEDAARVRWALDRAASMLRKGVEVRSIASIRGERWGRIAALGVLFVYAAIAGVRALVVPRNVALHKPVVASSVWYTPADGQDIVDGDIGTSFGIHTQMEESPNVVIDLLDNYRVQRVKVHNRVDGWYDDCLPLVVELSTDGKTYAELARRDDHFDSDPPWIAEAGDKLARYVRVRVARKSYLALSEVEVFG
ncbi:MAG: discoidin domain-containing protein, partial [Myxococcota bacterium]|nr:discoidin domain-containing protein [Myxococcota bacterium]